MNTYELAAAGQAATTDSGITFDRSKRVVLFTLVLAVLNWFDLRMTLQAFDQGNLYEANPIAAFILSGYGSIGISIFKTILVSAAVIGFLLGRRLPLAEFGCVSTSLIYSGVAVAWLCYPIEILF